MTNAKLTQRVVPSLLARNIEATLGFYEKLGFTVSGFYPSKQNATWVELERDGITLRFYSQPPKGTLREPSLSGTLYFFPQNLDALVEELHGRVEFAWGPEIMDYGMREFAVQDPNGYFLAFTEPV